MDSSIRRLVRYLFISLPLFAQPASAQFAVGPEFRADDRQSGSGFIPGDAGYWVGNSPDGYVYACWSEDRPFPVAWDLFCRTFSPAGPLNDPLPLVQTVSQNVFFPTGCADSQGNVSLIWVSSGTRVRGSFAGPRDDLRGSSARRPRKWQRADSGGSDFMRRGRQRLRGVAGHARGRLTRLLQQLV